MNPNDSAFPYDYTGDRGPSWGLTKRELISALIMASLMNANAARHYAEEKAMDAVEAADRLLEQLGK